MSRSLHIGLAFGLVLTFSGFSVSNVNAQKRVNRSHKITSKTQKRAPKISKTNLENILRRIRLHNKVLVSLRADVALSSFDSVLNVVDTSTGSMTYISKTAKRGMYVRLDWSKPREAQLVLMGDNFEIYRPSLNLVYTGRLKQTLKKSGVDVLELMSMSEEELKRNYKIKYLGQKRIGKNIKAWHLKFLPVNTTNKTFMELWVDVDGMPHQFKVTEPNLDTETFLLSNIIKNMTVKAEIFKLKYPMSVKKVKL